tara:strand:- start:10144 stop:10542 length:399 start_codon:yes stop_codon:yes gene_type:complete
MKNPPDKCLICGESKLEIIPDDVLQVILSLIEPLEQLIEKLEKRTEILMDVDDQQARKISILEGSWPSSPAPTVAESADEIIAVLDRLSRCRVDTYTQSHAYSHLVTKKQFNRLHRAASRLLKAHGVEDKGE